MATACCLPVEADSEAAENQGGDRAHLPAEEDEPGADADMLAVETDRPPEQPEPP